MLFRSLNVVVSKSHEISFQVSKWFSAAIIALLFLYLLSCDETIVYPPGYDCGDNDSIGVWKFLGLENETVTAIAVHPQKPNIIFAGTEKDFSAGIPGRLYRSIDCGKTWQVLFEGVGHSQSVSQVVFDPKNSNIVYAIPHPILKSTDGGNTWKDISNGIALDWETRVSQIAIDPINPKIIYAGTGGFFGGTLYKSTDNGTSWINLYRNEDETPGLRDGVISLAIDPNNSNKIYAGTAWRCLILKSTNAGYTWIVSNDTDGLINSITIDHNSSQTIYTAIGQLLGFKRSLDGGNSWHSFNEGLGDSVSGVKIITNPVNTDLFSLAFSNSNTGVFVKKQSNEVWEKFNTSNIIISSYSDIYITKDGRYLFLGSYSGMYKIKLE
ncbi:MAG: hypothetical protein HXY48_12670 [Ignavibacteriaceae bacterium]|nr:hypothetical protein [Ignavibacteriaceae bacterium]